MTRFIGSWKGIAAVIIFCVVWLAIGIDQNTLTLALSVIAISMSQLILMDTDKLTRVEHKKLDAIIAGTDADDSVAGEPFEGKA